MRYVRLFLLGLLALAALLLGGPSATASPGTAERVSVASDGAQGNDYSWFPSISGDGRYVAFGSKASNLVPGDTNGTYDVFVHDLGDVDGDGQWDPFDNCPDTATPWFTPVGDDDCDGFPSSVAASGRAAETYLGTDPNDNCTNDPDDPNDPNDPFHDAWPLDNNVDRFVNSMDVGAYEGKLPSEVTTPELQRLDLNEDGFLNSQEVLSFYRGMLPLQCT